MIKRFVLLLGLLIGPFAIAMGQLAQLKPVLMERLDVPANDNKKLAYVEIIFSEPVEGAKISKDNYASVDKEKEPTPTSIFARVIADATSSRGVYGKSITVVHPDYLPCVLEFNELGLAESVKPGQSYRITIDVPAANLVKAHRAFADLNYPEAREYYNMYINEGGDLSALASQRIAIMDKLQQHLDYLNNNAGSSDRSTRIRMMKCAKDIYDLTSSMEAYRRYQNLRSQLIANRGSGDIDGVSTVVVDSIWYDERDGRARSDTSLPLVEGNAYYSWIITKIGLDDVTFETEGLFTDPEKVNGEYVLKVSPGNDGPKKLIVHHPDCAPVYIDLEQYGIAPIKPASVYNIVLDAPPATVIEADRAFANLDFHSAQALYGDILQNSDQYPEQIVSIVSEKLVDVGRLQDRDFRTTWRRLRDFFVKRPTASREELASRADSLARMSEELIALKIPGMENNARHYADRAKEYRNSIYLGFNVTEVNKRKEILVGNDGNTKPLDSKTLLVEFKVPGLSYNYPVKANAVRPGEFGIYLPKSVSDWLSRNPGREIEIVIRDPSTRKKYDIQAGKKNGFKIALESSSDRSITANIYSKSLANS